MLTLASLPLAAALPEEPCLLGNLGTQLNGMLVIFLALASLWIVVDLIARIQKLLAGKSTPAAPAPVAVAPVIAPAPAPVAAPAPAPAPVAAVAPAPAPAIAPGVTPETTAVIIAAVHATLGKSARIAQIVPIMTNTWARDGRRQIFSSHQPR